ncbi:DNA methyltransferase [Actinokineospora bangkokensis]|nr:DNA methyltransferase [Actinokineospora bangkokensis]
MDQAYKAAGLTPYYETEHVVLYHGDAVDILPLFATGAMAAVVTDPPYVTGTSSSQRRIGHVDLLNAARFYSAWYRLAAAAIDDAGALWTCASWRTLPVVLYAAAEAGLPVTAAAVWDKLWIGPGSNRGLRSRYEMCLLLPRPGFRVRDRGAGDVWRIQASSRKPHGHPAQKPETLMRHILDITEPPPGGVILDPFAGSGTTLAAARAAGYGAVGIEASERWCEVIATRLDAADAG